LIGNRSLNLHELSSRHASAWSRSRREGRSRQRKPQARQLRQSTSDFHAARVSRRELMMMQ
jgi:hypothetical protein